MYILLILSFLLLTIIIYFYKTTEHLDEDTIYSDKNIFINNQQKMDVDTINVNRLCIKDAKGVECINKYELFNALELPIFRKHTYCIDDACLTKNNLKKIKGLSDIKLKSVNDEDKCIGFSNIPASLSLRTQKKWETDKFGLKIGVNDTDNKDYNKITYNSLYEPKGGWVLSAKDGQKCTNGMCCKKGVGKSDYDNVLKYGCKARHRSSPGVCWESAGKRCNNLRNIRRNSINAFYRYKNRTQVDIDMQNLPALNLPSMKDEECKSDNTSMNFKIDEGKLKSDITGLINSEISTKKYKNISTQHESHSGII